MRLKQPARTRTRHLAKITLFLSLTALGFTALSPMATAATTNSVSTQAARIISHTKALMRNGFTVRYTSSTNGSGTLSAPATKDKEQPLRYYSDILEVSTWSTSDRTLIQIPTNAATAPLRTGKNKYAWVSSTVGFKNTPGWLGIEDKLNSYGTPDQIASLVTFDTASGNSFTGSITKGEYPYLSNDAFAPILDSDLDVQMTSKNGTLSTLSLRSHVNKNRSITMRFLSLGKPGATYPQVFSIVNHQQAVEIVDKKIGPSSLAEKILTARSKNIETALDSIAKTKAFTDLGLQFGRTITGWVLFDGPSYPDEPLPTNAEMMINQQLHKAWCIDTSNIKPFTRACTVEDKALLTGLFKP